MYDTLEFLCTRVFRAFGAGYTLGCLTLVVSLSRGVWQGFRNGVPPSEHDVLPHAHAGERRAQLAPPDDHGGLVYRVLRRVAI